MVAHVQSLSQSRPKILSIIFASLLGLLVIYVAGHSQSHILHDAAHDVRHATGFPCH